MKSVSDERIRAYFLGKLSVPEAEVFEEESAASADLTERAQLVERELADDFLRGALSAPDARLFEEKYLVTDARRLKVQTAEKLWRIAGERSKHAAAAQSSFRQKIFGGQRVLRLAACGVLLLLVFGVLAFYFTNDGVTGNEVAAIKVSEPPAATDQPVMPVAETDNRKTLDAPPNSADPEHDREVDKAPNSPAKNQTETKNPSTPKTNARNSATPAVITLFAGTLRDQGEQFINISREKKSVSVQLKLPVDAGRYQIYRIQLKPVEGETVYSSQNLGSLNFVIPADKLENRTYILFLEGKNAPSAFESVAEYSFRVRR